VRRGLLLVALCALALPGFALEPPYLKDWPTAERVLADHQGENPEETMALQMAALNVLSKSIEDIAGPRRWHGLTSDEEALRGQYRCSFAGGDGSPRSAVRVCA
jgi:hypothetical protein